jgi:hypothetical protein
MTLPDGIAIDPTGNAFDLEVRQTITWDGGRLVWIPTSRGSAPQAQQLGLV